MRFRQVHLDFHTSEKIDGIGKNFSKKQFQTNLKKGYVDSITLFSKCHHGWAYPCEPGADMDIVKIREKYGKKLSLKGGINKYVLSGTKEDIRRELEYKLSKTTMGGGTIFGIDHRIPNCVSIENYRYYVNLGREILELPKAKNEIHIPMAF